MIDSNSACSDRVLVSSTAFRRYDVSLFSLSGNVIKKKPFSVSFIGFEAYNRELNTRTVPVPPSSPSRLKMIWYLVVDPS